LEADVKRHRIRNTWQILCACAALQGCSSNRSPTPQDLSGTVIQGAGDTGDAGDPTHKTNADAAVGSAATGNGSMPPPDMMMTGSGTGGNPANTGGGGQPGANADAGGPSSGTGGRGSRMPPVPFDGGAGEPDDDDDFAPDAATDAGPDAGFDDDDDDEHEAE
jgi:hypothetical protein